MARPRKIEKPTFGSIETRVGATRTTYRAIWQVAGKPQKRTFDSYDDALHFLNEQGAEIHRGGTPVDVKKPATPFREYAAQWYAARPGAKHFPLERKEGSWMYVKGEPLTPEGAEFAGSRRRERSAIAMLNEVFGDDGIGYITRHDVQAWVNDTDLGANTVRSYYSTLRSLMNDADEDGYLPRGMSVGERKVKLPPLSKRMIWLLDDQQDRLLEVARERFTFDYAMVHVAAHTGIRESEALALRRPNYNPLGHFIDIVEALKPGGLAGSTKTRKERRIDLYPCCVEVLNAHLAGHSSVLVFPAPRGGQQTLDNFRNRAWSPLRKAAGFEEMGLHFHDLRHSHCASLLAAGWEVLEVAERLGHESAKMTLDVYGKAIPGRQKKLLLERGIRAS